MTVHADLSKRLLAMFAPLDKVAAKGSVPPIGFLAMELSDVVPTTAGKSAQKVVVARNVGIAFSTAAIDMWLRSIHGFLMSCAMTAASPIWASVAGYYASHYSMRGFAHLLGYFQLFRKKRIVFLEPRGANFDCLFQSKGANDREHVFYWKVVKNHPQFALDPLFTINDSGTSVTDVGHRDRASYADHLGQLPTFQVLDIEALRQRITRISRIHFGAPPIPRLENFPDIEAVQVIAYHRIVRFRQLLDESVGTKNRFWRVHREPSWITGLMDFQLAEQGGPFAVGA
jgi:hypothetical protein